MSTEAPVKDVAAVEKEILDILGKDTISEADQKVLHDLRAEHPDHFKAVVETAPSVSGRGAEVTAAADAHAARVAAATPPAPAPVATTVEIRKAADIPGLSDAIKNGNKDEIIKEISSIKPSKSH